MFAWFSSHGNLINILSIPLYIYKFFLLVQRENKKYFKIRRSTKRFVFFSIYSFILFLHKCMFPAWCFRQRTCTAQRLLKDVFKKTWTHSCVQFEWFSVGNVFVFLWRSPFSFSESVFPLVYFNPLQLVSEVSLKKNQPIGCYSTRLTCKMNWWMCTNQTSAKCCGICSTSHRTWKCGTRPFLWWVRAQGRSPHAPGISQKCLRPRRYFPY